MTDNRSQVENVEEQEHESEVHFADYVEEVLTDEYGEENVERGVAFSDDRVADFVVDAGWFGFTYELENDAESVLKGRGQAEWYAENVDNAVGVLCLPKGHIDEEERAHILEKSDVLLREIPFEGDVSDL